MEENSQKDLLERVARYTAMIHFTFARQLTTEQRMTAVVQAMLVFEEMEPNDSVTFLREHRDRINASILDGTTKRDLAELDDMDLGGWSETQG